MPETLLDSPAQPCYAFLGGVLRQIPCCAKWTSPRMRTQTAADSVHKHIAWESPEDLAKRKACRERRPTRYGIVGSCNHNILCTADLDSANDSRSAGPWSMRVRFPPAPQRRGSPVSGELSSFPECITRSCFSLPWVQVLRAGPVSGSADACRLGRKVLPPGRSDTGCGHHSRRYQLSDLARFCASHSSPSSATLRCRSRARAVIAPPW